MGWPSAGVAGETAWPLAEAASTTRALKPPVMLNLLDMGASLSGWFVIMDDADHAAGSGIIGLRPPLRRPSGFETRTPLLHQEDRGALGRPREVPERRGHADQGVVPGSKRQGDSAQSIGECHLDAVAIHHAIDPELVSPGPGWANRSDGIGAVPAPFRTELTPEADPRWRGDVDAVASD